MRLTVEWIDRADALTPRDIESWNQLAANPFQRWEWLGSWWHAYQGKNQLHLLAVRRHGEMIGLAPWYLERRISTGRTLQFLASGKACTDHLSILVRPEDTQEVCDAIAHSLAIGDSTHRGIPSRLHWDSMEFIGVDLADVPMNCLVQSMRRCGLSVEQLAGDGIYVIDLPPSWDDYVSMRSKSGRREIRQAMNQIDGGEIVLKSIRDEAQLEEYWDTFVSLHQRRRHASGTDGCFDWPPFGQFLRRAASELLKVGMLELVVASIDGSPVAMQLAIVDRECWYFYQSGMEPDASQFRPGGSLFCHTIRQAIETGKRRFDMMRGDEPYKLRWRAERHPTQEIRACSPRPAAQVRQQVYNVGQSFKNLMRYGLGLLSES